MRKVPPRGGRSPGRRAPGGRGRPPRRGPAHRGGPPLREVPAPGDDDEVGGARLGAGQDLVGGPAGAQVQLDRLGQVAAQELLRPAAARVGRLVPEGGDGARRRRRAPRRRRRRRRARRGPGRRPPRRCPATRRAGGARAARRAAPVAGPRHHDDGPVDAGEHAPAGGVGPVGAERGADDLGVGQRRDDGAGAGLGRAVGDGHRHDGGAEQLRQRPGGREDLPALARVERRLEDRRHLGHGTPPRSSATSPAVRQASGCAAGTATLSGPAAATSAVAALHPHPDVAAQAAEADLQAAPALGQHGVQVEHARRGRGRRGTRQRTARQAPPQAPRCTPEAVVPPRSSRSMRSAEAQQLEGRVGLPGAGVQRRHDRGGERGAVRGARRRRGGGSARASRARPRRAAGGGSSARRAA